MINSLQKLWQLLILNQCRRAAILLFCMMFVGMVLETVGVGVLLPALTVMGQSDLAARYPALGPWLNRFGNPTHEQLVVAGMLILVGVYAVKALFLAFLAWQQARFVFGMQASLSQRLFIGYLRQPYTFHLQHNSAQLIRNVVNETNQLAQSGMMAGMLLLTEGLVLFGIATLLVIIEPFGALLVITTIGCAGVFFYRITRRRILRWGQARQYHEGLRIQHLQQGLGGVKDAKLLGREDDFFVQYQVHNVGSALVGQRQATLQALPRLWLELLAVVGLASLVLVMIGQERSLEYLLPTLGLFAAAAFRLMPSVNRILVAVQAVRYVLPVINTLHSELCLLDNVTSPQRGQVLPYKKSFVLENIKFRYPAADTSALCGISLSVDQGTSVGFVGQSGAGKSTLVDIVLGLLTPESGVVKVDGIDIQTNLRGWQDQIGYVPQSIFLTDDTLRSNVAFGLPKEQIDEAAVWRAIKAAQLEEFVSELPQGLETIVGERGIRLSGGQRQRIGIARALYHDPPVLVLDEATSSLDTDTERGVMDAVRALHGDKTILIVAHRLSTVEHCDLLFRLEKGRLVDEGETSVMLKVKVVN